MTTKEIQAEARRLHAEWRAAAEWVKHPDNPLDDEETDAASRLEYATYDALVEFVECNDLNYGEFDPRGPFEGGE